MNDRKKKLEARVQKKSVTTDERRNKDVGLMNYQILHFLKYINL